MISLRPSAQSITRPPPTLLSLPGEVLVMVSHNLPKNDIITLARVAPRLSFLVADKLLWSELNISLPEYYGEYPLVQPFEKQDTWDDEDPHRLWAAEEGVRAENRRRVALRDLVHGYMMRGNRERWNLVKRIKLLPRPGAAISIATLLEIVAPNLISLEMDGPIPHRHPTIGEWLPEPQHTLQAKMIGTTISFESLTRIRIGYGAVTEPSFIRLLVNIAPNLTFLDYDIMRFSHPDESDTRLSLCLPENITDKTKLRSLRARYQNSQEFDDPTTALVLQIVEQSSALEMLSLLDLSESPNGLLHVVNSLVKTPLMKDLFMGGDDLEPLSHYNATSLHPLTVRRLILQSWHWSDAFILTWGFPFPQLELLYLDASARRPRPDLENPATLKPSTYTMLPYLSKTIRSCPRLRVIRSIWNQPKVSDISLSERLDNLEASETGYEAISSYIHADEELLLARILIGAEEKSDREATPMDEDESSNNFPYFLDSGPPMRTRVFEPLEVEALHTFTDFRGVAVPLEILESMREVQGATEKEWTGRRIAVGEKAWAALLRWYASRTVGSPT